MRIDINLLEEKDQPNRLPVLIVGAGLFVMVLVGVVFYWQHLSLTQEREELDKQYRILQSDLESYQRVQLDPEIEQRQTLSEAAQNIKTTIFPTIELVERMVALLPERGYFEAYDYYELGLVEVEARFDSLQGVAAYTSALTAESFVRNVTVDEVYTLPVEAGLDRVEYRPRYIANFTIQIEPNRFRQEVSVDES
ncbi:hypothetical protein EQV77_01150 [Halobacillus fulvus]|nr:hypothetical protein EQV77_01150 [Halobacillus fulvus]